MNGVEFMEQIGGGSILYTSRLQKLQTKTCYCPTDQITADKL